jgi:hypothetical protein
MPYTVRLYDENEKLIGEVPVNTTPGQLRHIKVRFEGECSGSPPSLFGGEKWFVRDGGTINFYAMREDSVEFVEAKDIVLAPVAPNLTGNQGYAATTPQQMLEKATELAKEIYALPDHELRERLAKLRGENPAMHALVTANGKKLRPPTV